MSIKTKIVAKYNVISYRLKNHIFSWGVDSDNDITLSVFGIAHFVKYKEQTIVCFGKKTDLRPAPKYYNKNVDC